MSEVAFVMMDFDHHGHREYAWQFLNVYLSVTGDYRGLELLSLYLVYRAMVRAKVACIRHLQCHGQGHPMPDVDSHLALALRYAAEPRPRLFITHGFSGSGKSWWSERLARMLPAIHLRSDVERRREFTAAGAAPAKEDLYSAENIASIYARLLDLAGSILDSGKAVIVDATFLKHDQRERFLSMSQNRGVRALILDVECDEALMRRRIVKRLDHGNDPSEADTRVLDEQLRKAHPLSASERRSTVTIRSGEEKDTDAVLARISAIS
jgi:predicted kinase